MATVSQLLSTVSQMNQKIQSLEKQLKDKPKQQDSKDIEKKVADTVKKELPGILHDAIKREIAVEIVQSTKNVVNEMKSEYTTRVKDAVVNEVSKRVNESVKDVRKGLVNEYKKTIKLEFTHLFEDNILPHCEKVIGDAMGSLLKKVDGIVEKNKDEMQTMRDQIKVQENEYKTDKREFDEIKDNMKSLKEKMSEPKQEHPRLGQFPKPKTDEQILIDNATKEYMQFDRVNSTQIFTSDLEIDKDFQRTSSLNSSMIAPQAFPNLIETPKHTFDEPTFDPQPPAPVFPEPDADMQKAAKILTSIVMGQNMEAVNKVFSNSSLIQKLGAFIKKNQEWG